MPTAQLEEEEAAIEVDAALLENLSEEAPMSISTQSLLRSCWIRSSCLVATR